MADKKILSSREKSVQNLTLEQFHVTQEAGTEPAFTGKYWDARKKGVYRCVCCGEALFSSETKFDSGSGWPSFWKPIEKERVATRTDSGPGLPREEVICANCNAHLGHVFEDGPEPTGLRYCINSASLDLDGE